MRIKSLHEVDGKPRYICPNCVKSMVESILQARKKGTGESLECHTCKLSIVIKANVSTYRTI